jgi:hypothetical protein
VGGGVSVVQFEREKYLWGNVPAFDIVQLGQIEGGEYGGQLHLLFAGMCGFEILFRVLS